MGIGFGCKDATASGYEQGKLLGEFEVPCTYTSRFR